MPRREIYDPQFPQELAHLALGATNRHPDGLYPVSAQLRGRQYLIHDEGDNQERRVTVVENGKNTVSATTSYDDYQRPLAIRVSVTTPRGDSSVIYARERKSTAIATTPASGQLGRHAYDVAHDGLYAAGRALGETEPHRRKRASGVSPQSQGQYENSEYKPIPEYPQR